MPQLTQPVVAAGRLAHADQPRLRIEGLLLRPWIDDDVPALVNAYADPAIQRWHVRSLTVQEAGQYVTDANAAWKRETAADWAVTENDVLLGQDVLLGRISLRRVDLNEGLATIAYWVVPAGRGRSVAPRALVAVSDWALNELGLHRLELEHSTANAASCRVADKAGYTYESTRHSQAWHVDGWHDMHAHVLLRKA